MDLITSLCDEGYICLLALMFTGVFTKTGRWCVTWLTVYPLVQVPAIRYIQDFNAPSPSLNLNNTDLYILQNLEKKFINFFNSDYSLSFKYILIIIFMCVYSALLLC